MTKAVAKEMVPKERVGKEVVGKEVVGKERVHQALARQVVLKCMILSYLGKSMSFIFCIKTGHIDLLFLCFNLFYLIFAIAVGKILVLL